MQLDPFPYHLAVSDRLERAEPDPWQRFRSEHIGDLYREVTLTDLRQRATPLERGRGNEHRYALAEAARDRLGIDAPITLLQLREAAGTARSFLVFMPDEVLVVFAGNILDLLGDDAALTAALGREMARFSLYRAREGRIHIATRLLHWLVRQDGCPPEMAETSRRFALVTEAYCDLGGFIAAQDRAAALRVLFAGLPDAATDDASRYVELADAPPGTIGDWASTGIPSELAARALALARSTSPEARDPYAGAGGLVSGPIDLGSLDLLDQDALRDLTRSVVARVLSEPAGGTPRAIAHAREMFPEDLPDGGKTPIELPSRPLASSVVDYLAYLLLDLATVEGTRLRDAIAVAATAADEIGIGVRFREIARQELRGRRGLQAGLARRAA